MLQARAPGCTTRVEQSPEAIRWLVLLTVGLGALIAVAVIPVAWRYPTDQAFMARVKAALALRKSEVAA